MNRVCSILTLAASVACTPTPTTKSRSELMDPKTCEECHPDHYREWAGSMHAYASDDPFFRAMNTLGQDATNGELGDSCVRCHAPMAVREGMTTDGLNLDDLPSAMRGVGCYFCHNAIEVEGLHNNQIALADDTTMRSGVEDPVETPAHGSAYSALHDGRQLQSSQLCGSCHDVVTPSGVALERVYTEWDSSFYADADDGGVWPAYYSQRCNSCHLSGSSGAIADAEGARADRRRHAHHMTGPGVVVTRFPDAETHEQLRAANLEAMHELRDAAVCASLCVEEVDGDTRVTLWLHNETVGHGWPSGAAQDRRAWIELRARRDGAIVYESGVIGPEDAVAKSTDPDLWWFGDRIYDAEDQPVHAHWEVARYESGALPVATTLGGDADTWIPREYTFPGALPTEVELRMWLRPMPRDLLDDLVDAGYLDAQVRDDMPTFEVAPVHLDWSPAVAEPSGSGSCVHTASTCKSPWIESGI